LTVLIIINSTFTPATVVSLQNSLTTMLNALISFGSTSLENITSYKSKFHTLQ